MLRPSSTGRYEEPSIHCFVGARHRRIAAAALLSLALFLAHATLLPPGSYRECRTLRDSSLDVLYVPVFLQVQDDVVQVLWYEFLFCCL